jgi:hypothetical protein
MILKYFIQEQESHLWVHGELSAEPEGVGLVLAVLCKLGAQADQGAVQPAHDVRHVLLRDKQPNKRAREVANIYNYMYKNVDIMWI